MRIIGGDLGGRRIHPPANMPHTRPTTDIAKGGLFNILENNLDIPSLRCLELFGGTGSITFELASRGATNLTVVEKDNTMAGFIAKTAAQLEIAPQIVKMDAFRYLQQGGAPFDFIFADPPYEMGNMEELPRLVFAQNLLKEEGWFVLEHTRRNDFRHYPYFRAERNYGTTIFTIFINREELKTPSGE
ncbi:RsmD family RNA methyltransferase [Chitinophaga deserti]|uniref:RsmD family RNA methyltransferase n=1 Tax=Chitinophaga deserti TaxID=2164099 RepID=UPI000D6B7BED|nr:RsmD family RNA methyltransferase [Chitinophaga deserti]